MRKNFCPIKRKKWVHLIYSICVVFWIPLILVSCSSLPFRSYEDEMERVDSTSFEDRSQFPVVSGDTGRDWFTKEERFLRTPASRGIFSNTLDRTLELELKKLESSLNFTEERFYLSVKHKLSSVSEKIYFLRLHPSEKKRYLNSKGFLIKPYHKSNSSHVQFSSNQQKNITVGMTKNDVFNYMGRPVRVDVSGDPTDENERWFYENHESFQYVFFESGRVDGWQ